MRCGTRVKICNRLPEPEEYYLCVFSDGPYVVNGHINFDALVEHLKNRQLHHFSRFGDRAYNNDYHNTPGGRYTTVAVVEV